MLCISLQQFLLIQPCHAWLDVPAQWHSKHSQKLAKQSKKHVASKKHNGLQYSMQSVGLENAKVTDFGFPACLFICRIAFWPWHTAEFAVMMLNIVLSYCPVWTGPLYSSSLTCFAKMPCPKNWWMGGTRTRMMFLSWPEKWLFIGQGPARSHARYRSLLSPTWSAIFDTRTVQYVPATSS